MIKRLRLILLVTYHSLFAGTGHSDGKEEHPETTKLKETSEKKKKDVTKSLPLVFSLSLMHTIYSQTVSLWPFIQSECTYFSVYLISFVSSSVILGYTFDNTSE
jgi:hypothetical protein